MLSKKYWIAMICKLFFIASSFIITIFINRGLGVENKGIYAYVIHIVEVLYVFFSFGIGQAYSTFKRNFEDLYRSVFIFLGFVNGLAALGILTLFTYLFNLQYGLIVPLLTAVEVVKVVISMIAVIEDSIKRNIIMTVLNVVYLVVLASCYYADLCSLNIFLMLYGLNDILLIAWLMTTFKMKIEYQRITDRIVLLIYKTGFITMIVMLLISINYSIDIIMLKQLSNSYYTGLYSVAVTFSNMFLVIPDSFKEVLFGDSAKKNFDKSLVYKSIKVSILFSVVILFCFILFGKLMINILYGSDFTSSYDLTIILFTGSLSMIFFKILQPVYISHGEQNRAALFLACSAITNILLNIYLIPKMNAIGAAIASAISYTLCGGLFFLNFKKKKVAA